MRWIALAAMLSGVLLPSAAAQAREDVLDLRDVLYLVAARSTTIRAIEAEVAVARAERLQARAPFALAAELRAEARDRWRVFYPATKRPVARRVELALEKRLRNGLVFRPHVNVSPTTHGGRTGGGLSVTFPVLRGRSFERAREHSYRLNLESSVLDAQHERARHYLKAATAYFDLWAAHEQQRILSAAEGRAEELKLVIEKLADAGERPRADVESAAAHLADRSTQQLGAAQAKEEAAARLGVLVGEPGERISGKRLAVRIVPDTERLNGQLEEEPAGRNAALEAQELALRASEARLHAARRERHPRFDLIGSLIHSEAGAGGTGVAAGGVTVAVVMSRTLSNAAARGLAWKEAAATAKHGAALVQLQRSVAADRKHAATALRYSLQELQAARRALEAHRRVAENERKKLGSGVATLFDVIIADERLTTARLKAISAEAKCARAAAVLAFERGRLTGGDDTRGIGVLTRLFSGDEEQQVR